MKPYLLDVNVLMALAWRNQVHHAIATEWFNAKVSCGFRTCPFTQAGFVRLSTNASVVLRPVRVSEALGLMGQIVETPGHQFWPDDISLAEAVKSRMIIGYRQVTDAYLIALAESKGGIFATLDRGALSIGGAVELVRAA